MSETEEMEVDQPPPNPAEKSMESESTEEVCFTQNIYHKIFQNRFVTIFSQVVQRCPEDEVRDEDGGIHVDGIYIPPPPPPSLTFECEGPRLVITHIENENFKSYAGKQTLGPFHKSFTSIIGPNGSGKSNVIDSMLFVFGYRANKIRSKKISVLIHNSENHPDVRSCKVRVFFQVTFILTKPCIFHQ